MKAIKKYLNYIRTICAAIMNQIPSKLIFPLIIIGGIITGLGAYIVYASKAHSYLSNDPSACINCHVMIPYYQSWSRSSHTVWTNCNDCHVPHSNIFSKYTFKAIDGLYHSAVFTVNGESQSIRSRKGSSNVIMENCIRCHTHLNTAFVKTGMITYSQAIKGKGKACWDCHTKVPHMRISSLSSSPKIIVPLSQSPVPDWLKDIMKKNKS
ncbi:MAG: cytochrome c nitrite reductase small subunit [Leptospirales bacterium]|nr:cytochrome c nitrite reductase small subunit [Leptospirales bacterium]